MTRRAAGVDPKGFMLYKPGWKDLLSSINSAKTAGANVPAWTNIRDGLYGYGFSAAALKEVFVNFHVPHDYMPQSDIYPHIHYVPTTDEVQGVVRWGFEFTYSDREGTLPASTTVYVEQTIAANSQYEQLVAETADADALSGQDYVFEVDGVLVCRVFRDGAHANDTYAGVVVGTFVDLHYLSDRDTTLNKAAPFRE